MTSCSHHQLLRLVEEDRGYSLQYGKRLAHIAHDLPRPLRQYPSTLLLVGRKLKTQAVRKIYPGSRILQQRHRGIANIVIEHTSVDAPYPLIISDLCPCVGPQQYPQAAEERCHGLKSYPLQLPAAREPFIQREDLLAHIQARLVFLFTDVLCIFSEGPEGLAGVAAQLAQWAALGSASMLEYTTRPRVVVVTRSKESIPESQKIPSQSQLLAIPRFADSFSSLIITTVSESFEGLKETLSQEVNAARACRLKTDTLFSAAHNAALFEIAISNFATTFDAKFDFISNARVDTPVNRRFSEHLQDFASLCVEHEVPRAVLTSFISSTILLSSYPPGMHCESRRTLKISLALIEQFSIRRGFSIPYTGPLLLTG